MAIPLRFPDSGNLYRPGFDTSMVVGLPVVALITALTVMAKPEWFGVVLAIDLWLLGYHHVLATFTRTALDRESFRRYWALNLLVPVLVFSALFALAVSSNSAALWITTLYLHWQLFHYIRQSEGIAKAYAGRGGRRPSIISDPVFRVALYAVPITSFLTMAARGQNNFLGFPVWLPQLSTSALIACWVATLLLCTGAIARGIRSYRAGELTPQHLTFVLSHYLVFTIAYAGIRDIALSWLMANIWHNGQYLAFVWAQNRQRFNDRIDDRHRLLSTLSQRKNAWLYVGFCLTLTFATYSVASWIQQPLKQLTGLGEMALLVVIYQSINFHHYIIDAFIWRRPKPKTTMVVAPATG
jgi:hypothetical protein